MTPDAPENVDPGAAPPNPLWELVLMRIRATVREPEGLFWIFAFPLLISVALGIAFKSQEARELAVTVADGPQAEEVRHFLDGMPNLAAARTDLEEGKDLLRRGRVAAVLIPGVEPDILTDPTQPDSRMARLLVVDAVERMRGRKDLVQFHDQKVTAPGARYIDFLIPGLLGMSLMNSGIWGVGWAVVQMRTGRLLKRLAATPMRRSHFLLSFVLGRLLLALVEILFFLAFARLLFDVRVFGSTPGLVVFGLFGALSFGGVSLMIAARARTAEAASGLMNLLTMPMTVLSGVFFSASNFPAWSQPLIKLLPLTALIDGMRAIMVDGASILSLPGEVAVLLAWGAMTFFVALKWFRWN